MEHMKYWSKKTNLETGDWSKFKRQSVETDQNDMEDMKKLIGSEYGAKLTEQLHIQYKYAAPSKEGER